MIIVTVLNAQIRLKQWIRLFFITLNGNNEMQIAASSSPAPPHLSDLHPSLRVSLHSALKQVESRRGAPWLGGVS